MDRLFELCANYNIIFKPRIEFQEYVKDFDFIYNFLPNLEFDQEFEKVINHKAFQCVFDTAKIDNISKPYNCVKFGYPANIYPVERNFIRESTNPFLSKYLKPEWLEIGYNLLGNPKILEDLFFQLKKYYLTKIPSKKEDISNYFLCFEELLKLIKGRLYFEISLSRLKEKLTEKTPEKIVSKFLENFNISKQFQIYDVKPHNFVPMAFLEDYHNQLYVAIYVYHGIVRTGAFLAWRSFIKYIEYLQNEKEFKDKISTKLENWCFQKAEELGLKSEKIILINKDKTPTKDQKERYKDLKKRIQSFPRRSIEIITEFPIDHRNSYFKELDLVIQLKNLLIIVECKKTSAPMSVIPKIYNWCKLSIKQYKKTIKKINILYYILENSSDIHPFFGNKIPLHIPIIVRTEGYLSQYDRTPTQYIDVLKGLIEKKESHYKE